jgi:uncharacterized protein (DUF2267 family)
VFLATVEDRGEYGDQSEARQVTAVVLNTLGERLAGGERDASAVLSTVADAVTGGQLNQVLTQLQPGYATLFGKPELS